MPLSITFKKTTFLVWRWHCANFAQILMEKLKINYETVNEIYIIYDTKHRFLEILNIETPIEQYMSETPEAAYFEKMKIEDTIIYENEDEENEEEVHRKKKRVRA